MMLLSTVFLLDFRTISKLWYLLLCFSFYSWIKVNISIEYYLRNLDELLRHVLVVICCHSHAIGIWVYLILNRLNCKCLRRHANCFKKWFTDRSSSAWMMSSSAIKKAYFGLKARGDVHLGPSRVGTSTW